MIECADCHGKHAPGLQACITHRFRSHRINPRASHRRYEAQANAAVAAEIARLNAGGSLLTTAGANVTDPSYIAPLATDYAAQILETLDQRQVPTGHAEVHAAVGLLAVQAFVARVREAAILPDDLPGGH